MAATCRAAVRRLAAQSLLALLALAAISQLGAANALLMTPEAREACSVNVGAVRQCTIAACPYSGLSPEARDFCCDAVIALHDKGCFCGWGPMVDMNPWVGSVLLDLADVFKSCTAEGLTCAGAEEYLLRDMAAVSEFDVTLEAADIPMAKAKDVANAIDRSSALPAASLEDFLGPQPKVGTLVQPRGAGKDVSVPTTLPVRVPAVALARVVEPRVWLPLVTSTTYPTSNGANIEIEIEIEQSAGSGSPEDLSAALERLSRWAGAIAAALDSADSVSSLSLSSSASSAGRVGRGAAAAVGGDDGDLPDIVAAVLARLMGIVKELLIAPSSEVEVALEITVEQDPETPRTWPARRALPLGSDDSWARLLKLGSGSTEVDFEFEVMQPGPVQGAPRLHTTHSLGCVALAASGITALAAILIGLAARLRCSRLRSSACQTEAAAAEKLPGSYGGASEGITANPLVVAAVVAEGGAAGYSVLQSAERESFLVEVANPLAVAAAEVEGEERDSWRGDEVARPLLDTKLVLLQ